MWEQNFPEGLYKGQKNEGNVKPFLQLQLNVKNEHTKALRITYFSSKEDSKLEICVDDII